MLVLFIGMNIFQSCNKVKDAIISQIDPFNYSLNDVSFDIPAQPIALPLEYDTPEQTESVNINQVIHDNSGIGFNINDFSSIMLKDATLHLTNGTASSNWTNIEFAEVQANTDKGLNAGKPWLIANLNIPSSASEQFSDKTLTFDNNVNLKDYVDGNGTVIHYKFRIKPRLGTTDVMHVVATVRLEFKP